MPEFDELLDRFALWLGQRTDSARTIETYRRRVSQLHRWVSRSGLDVEIVELDHLTLRKFFEHEKERGLSPATRRALRAALVAFFDFVATEVHPGRENPARSIRIPKGQRYEPESWTPEEISCLLDAAWEAGTRNLRHLVGYFVLATALACGLRLRELTGLRLADVDLDHARLSVVGKGNKRRTVALEADTVSLLRRYLTEVRPRLPDSAFLFVNPLSAHRANHGQWGGRSVEHLFAEFGNLAGLRGRSYPHKARHTYASRLHAAGAATAVIQRQLGHSHLTTTAGYLHMLEDDVTEAIERVGSVIAFPDAPPTPLGSNPPAGTGVVAHPAGTPEDLAPSPASPPTSTIAPPTRAHPARSIAGAVTASLVTRSPVPLAGLEPTSVVEVLIETTASCLAVLESPDADALAAWANHIGLVEADTIEAVAEALTLAAAVASELRLPASRVLSRLGVKPVLAAWAAATVAAEVGNAS
jgi:site-specific recombinase XerD